MSHRVIQLTSITAYLPLLRYEEQGDAVGKDQRTAVYLENCAMYSLPLAEL